MVGNQRRRLKQFIIINNNYLLYRGNICTYIHIHVCMFIYIYIYIHNKDKEKKFTKRKSQSKFLNNF